MNKGIYTLILSLAVPKDIRIGALGVITFQPGYYIYAGSALGSGGLSRVARHIRFYRERYRKAKWHIDYLMEHTVFCGDNAGEPLAYFLKHLFVQRLEETYIIVCTSI